MARNCTAKNAGMGKNEENARQRSLDGKDLSGSTVKKIRQQSRIKAHGKAAKHGKAQKASSCTSLCREGRKASLRLV
jgi:hypothetical protein